MFVFLAVFRLNHGFANSDTFLTVSSIAFCDVNNASVYCCSRYKSKTCRSSPDFLQLGFDPKLYNHEKRLIRWLLSRFRLMNFCFVTKNFPSRAHYAVLNFIKFCLEINVMCGANKSNPDKRRVFVGVRATVTCFRLRVFPVTPVVRQYSDKQALEECAVSWNIELNLNTWLRRKKLPNKNSRLFWLVSVQFTVVCKWCHYLIDCSTNLSVATQLCFTETFFKQGQISGCQLRRKNSCCSGRL